MQATSGAKQKVSIQDGEMEQSLNFCLLRAVKAMKFEWRQKETTKFNWSKGQPILGKTTFSFASQESKPT